jgi:hypothetical protein
MKTKLLFGLLCTTMSAFAGDIDYVIEASVPAYTAHKTSYANSDNVSQNDVSDVIANALLGPIYEDDHPISVALLLNSSVKNSSVQLEMGAQTVISNNIRYEANFLGRAIFDNCFTTGLSLFFGGKFGIGESNVKASHITFIGNSIFNGSAVYVPVALPSTAQYYVSAGQIGATYAISKNIELITIAEIIGRTSDLSKQIDRDAAVRSAASQGMSGAQMTSMLEAMGPQTVLSYSINAGLRLRF